MWRLSSITLLWILIYNSQAQWSPSPSAQQTQTQQVLTDFPHSPQPLQISASSNLTSGQPPLSFSDATATPLPQPSRPSPVLHFQAPTSISSSSQSTKVQGVNANQFQIEQSTQHSGSIERQLPRSGIYHILIPQVNRTEAPDEPAFQILIPRFNRTISTISNVPISPTDVAAQPLNASPETIVQITNNTSGFFSQQDDEENSDIRSLPRSPPIDPVDESSYELMVELLASNATNSNVTGTQTIQFTFIPFSRNVENVKLIYTNQTMNDDSMTSDGDADMDQMNSQTVEMSQEKPQIWRKKINLPFNSQINYLISYDVIGRNRNTTIHTLAL